MVFANRVRPACRHRSSGSAGRDWVEPVRLGDVLWPAPEGDGGAGTAWLGRLVLAAVLLMAGGLQVECDAGIGGCRHRRGERGVRGTAGQRVDRPSGYGVEDLRCAVRAQPEVWSADAVRV